MGSAKARCKSATLSVITLEERTVPVVGALGDPGPIAAGGDYDGVVMINQAGGKYGTGALIRDASGGNDGGHFILTAAHIANTAQVVNFDLDGMGRVSRFAEPIPGQVRIPIPVSIADGYGAVHPDYNGSSHIWDYDVGVLKLVDPTTPDPNRLLVRPYGAQTYSPYIFTGELAQELGRSTTFVGYGDTGNGTDGPTIPPMVESA